MKKIYDIPCIDVSKFDTENIVTISGTALSADEKAINALKDEGVNQVVTVKWSF